MNSSHEHIRIISQQMVFWQLNLLTLFQGLMLSVH